MNRAAYEHLERAAREGRALEVELESMAWPEPGEDPSWQTFAWLVARGLARGRAAASLSSWTSNLHFPPEILRLEQPHRDVARALLAPARARLHRLGTAVRTVPGLGNDDAVGLLLQQLVDALLESDLPAELRLLERAADRQRVSANEVDDVEEALRQRAIARMIGVELTQLAGSWAAATFENRYLENLSHEDVRLLISVDQALQEAVPVHPILGPYAAWLEQEVFSPPVPSQVQADIPRSVATELRGAVDDLVSDLGLEGTMNGPELPWNSSAREGGL